jgi:hypothetical protein
VLGKLACCDPRTHLAGGVRVCGKGAPRVGILLSRFDVGALGHGHWLVISDDRPVDRELERFGLPATEVKMASRLTPAAAAIASMVVAT